MNKRIQVAELTLKQNEIPVTIHRKTVFIGGLICASLSYSEVLKMWYLRFTGFSDSVYELKEKDEVVAIVQKEFYEFVEELTISLT